MIHLGLQSAPLESDAISSFERTFGVPPILPGVFWGSVETPNYEFLTEFQQAIGASTPPCTLLNRAVTPTVPDDLSSCKFVLVRVDGSGRPPLAPLYSGLFLVLERYRSSFKLQVGTRQELVNISRLKPAFTPEDAEPAQPPKRGRPRKLQPRFHSLLLNKLEVVLLHPTSLGEKGVLLQSLVPLHQLEGNVEHSPVGLSPSYLQYLTGGKDPVEDDFTRFHASFLFASNPTAPTT